MPRYFFRCTNGCETVTDREGAELANPQTIEAYAHEIARGLMLAGRDTVSNWSEWIVHVTDEDGKTVLVVPFPTTMEH
jgi:hypothetical protein